MHNTFHDAFTISLMQSTINTKRIFHQFIVVQSQIRSSSISNCQSCLTFKGRTANHSLNYFNNKDKDFLPLCLPPRVIPLSVNHFDTEVTEKITFSWQLYDHFQTPISFQPVPFISEFNIYFLQKRCLSAVILDLRSILKSVLQISSSAP